YPSQAERGEALGVAVLEAMAARLPVVVTDLRCFRDYVHPEVTGVVLEDWKASDAHRRLASLLADLMTDGVRRERLGIAAQAAVSGFDYASVADAMLADFARLLRERS